MTHIARNSGLVQEVLGRFATRQHFGILVAFPLGAVGGDALFPLIIAFERELLA